MRVFLVLTTTLALMCVVCLAQGYFDPVNAALKCRDFGSDIAASGKGDKWYTFKSSDPCEDCCQRCYIARFDAAVVNAGCTYPGFCADTSAPCEVNLFVKTSPCNRCCESGTHMYSLTEECDGAELTQLHSTLSTCEIEDYEVCVGPNHYSVRSMFNGSCTATNQFSMEAYEDTCEQIVLTDCAESTTGSRTRWMFDDSANYNGWPNDCFWDHHFKSQHTSPCSLSTSKFQVWCPPTSGGTWLDKSFTKSELIPIDCDHMDALRAEKCQAFSPPV
jgi:hypothetical protein